MDSLLREDVLDFDNIQNLNAIRLTFELLRKRVGSPVSYSSIAEDVAISPNIARSLLKEPKIYFFDTGLVQGDQEDRFLKTLIL